MMFVFIIYNKLNSKGLVVEAVAHAERPVGKGCCHDGKLTSNIHSFIHDGK